MATSSCCGVRCTSLPSYLSFTPCGLYSGAKYAPLCSSDSHCFPGWSGGSSHHWYTFIASSILWARVRVFFLASVAFALDFARGVLLPLLLPLRPPLLLDAEDDPRRAPGSAFTLTLEEEEEEEEEEGPWLSRRFFFLSASSLALCSSSLRLTEDLELGSLVKSSGRFLSLIGFCSKSSSSLSRRLPPPPPLPPLLLPGLLLPTPPTGRGAEEEDPITFLLPEEAADGTRGDEGTPSRLGIVKDLDSPLFTPLLAPPLWEGIFLGMMLLLALLLPVIPLGLAPGGLACFFFNIEPNGMSSSSSSSSPLTFLSALPGFEDGPPSPDFGPSPLPAADGPATIFFFSEFWAPPAEADDEEEPFIPLGFLASTPPPPPLAGPDTAAGGLGFGGGGSSSSSSSITRRFLGCCCCCCCWALLCPAAGDRVPLELPLSAPASAATDPALASSLLEKEFAGMIGGGSTAGEDRTGRWGGRDARASYHRHTPFCRSWRATAVIAGRSSSAGKLVQLGKTKTHEYRPRHASRPAKQSAVVFGTTVGQGVVCWSALALPYWKRLVWWRLSNEKAAALLKGYGAVLCGRLTAPGDACSKNTTVAACYVNGHEGRGLSA